VAERLGQARLAFTSRAGGTSSPPYDGLNLAEHVGDEPAAVARNRNGLAEALEVDAVVVARQVHGRDVVCVDRPFDGEPPEADALVTRTPRLALAVLVADCTPVVVAAPAEGVVGVAHAGRAGLAAGVALALVDAMRDLGAGELVARVGPSICPRCYEVPLRLREQVADVVPEARSVSRTGTPALDVAGGVLAQLAPHVTSLRQLPGCTAEEPDLYSYRRDGQTGRSAGLAWLV
jgi:YfiH family protein